MNIIIPMAGIGSRFETEQAKKILSNNSIVGVGKLPKPYIEINGKTMIETAIDSLNISGKIILIINASHLKNKEVSKIINNIKKKYKNIIIFEGDKNIKGSATSALEAKKYINPNKELILMNLDQFFTKNFKKSFINHINKTENNGTIVTYDNKELKNSFAILDENENVIKLIEKPNKYINNSFATTGVNFWKKGKSFIEGCEAMIDKKILINGEYYVAPIYNENILSGEKFDTFETKDVKLVGTPYDLLNYIKSIKG